MLDAQQLILFVPAAAVFALAPGPDSVLLLGRAIGQGRVAGVAAAAGCSLGIVVTTV